MIYEHKAISTNNKNGKLFSKLMYDPENNIIAGITGWTWAGACDNKMTSDVRHIIIFAP